MDAKKCDKCGKFFEKSKNGKFDGGKVIVFNYGEFFHTEHEARINVDLCTECVKNLERWLKNESP